MAKQKTLGGKENMTHVLLQDLVMATNELVTVLMYAHDIDANQYYKWKDEQKALVMKELEEMNKNQFTQPEELAKAISEQLKKAQ